MSCCLGTGRRQTPQHDAMCQEWTVTLHLVEFLNKLGRGRVVAKSALPPISGVVEIVRAQSCSLDQSETSNSNCSGFNTFAKAASHRLRFALPYLIPFTAQPASAFDLGMIRSTITPTKTLHSGSLALTALVIATSSTARVKARRFVFKYLSESFAMTKGNLCHPPGRMELWQI
jgi:hypothetical protein